MNLQFSSIYFNGLYCLNKIKPLYSCSYTHFTEAAVLIFLFLCCICMLCLLWTVFLESFALNLSFYFLVQRKSQKLPKPPRIHIFLYFPPSIFSSYCFLVDGHLFCLVYQWSLKKKNTLKLKQTWTTSKQKQPKDRFYFFKSTEKTPCFNVNGIWQNRIWRFY